MDKSWNLSALLEQSEVFLATEWFFCMLFFALNGFAVLFVRVLFQTILCSVKEKSPFFYTHFFFSEQTVLFFGSQIRRDDPLNLSI